MNETLKNIKTRRSTRSFSEKQITDEELNAILEAGLYAPSAHNEQSWHFTVVQRQNILNKINDGFIEFAKNSEDEMLRQFAKYENLQIFYNAPTVIIVSGNQESLLPQVDCAAATENMLVAAEALGIGSCWIGLAYWPLNENRADEYKKELAIPENYKPYHAVSFGYKKVESKNIPERKMDKINYIR